MARDPRPPAPRPADDPALPAICLRCGAGRRLALARCDACGHAPVEERDRAAHLLVLELSGEERARLRARLREGERYEPDPEAVEATIEAMRGATPLAVGGYALLVGGVPFLLLVGLLGALAWALLPL